MADSARFDTHASAEHFQLLINAVTDYAVYMLDECGHVATWNPGARRFKGYEAGEIIGKHFSNFFTDEDREAGLPARALETSAREGKFESEGWRVRKDGTRFWAHVVIDPIRDDSGKLVGFAKITRDVTERKEAQEELETARAALFQAQKLQALGELTGGIAHDFNNLMTVIRGSADLLRREGLAEDRRRRYLDAIVETADRAATLTSHLLAFSRRQPLRPEVIDVNQRLDSLGEVLARTIGSPIEVVLDLGDGVWAARADAAQLETALLNGAINARDAMPGGGTLTIATRNVPASGETADMVEIALTDTGEGMSQEVASRAFEPFFTTKGVGRGTGLGLSQIHGFAAQTGGRAELHSRPGQGTTLRLFLPRASGDAAVRQPEEEPTDIPERLRILLVEDNDHVRDFARGLLEDLRCEVITAASAEEAMPILEAETVDLLFTDVVMPGRSGVDLARRAREARPDLPVLLASGFSDELVEGAGREFEAIAKPYGAGSLAAAIRRAMAQVRPADA
jgi:PAS domain S-box-containing protein